MKFLLTAVNAKFIHSNPAIYSLRAYVGERLLPNVELAEYTINQKQADILADIYLRKPVAIGFSCYIWNIEIIEGLIVELPKLLPDIQIWLGGPEASYRAVSLLQSYPQLTGIMVGEGEETFREVLCYYVDGDLKLPEIRGLCLPPGRFTGERPLLNMDQVPFLYKDMTPFDHRIIYYESQRGCPYSCSYCLSSIDKKVRLKNIELVKTELQYLMDERVPQVKFVDRTFNCVHTHAMEIWKYILEHDNGVTNFHFEISADILTEEEICLLHQMRPGLVQLEIGVQSVNEQTIQAIDRRMNVERLTEVVKKLHEGHNIHQHLDLIAGLPYEDLESFRHSFNVVYAMRPDQLQLGFLKVLQGSPMANRVEQYDLFYMDTPPYEVLRTKWLSFDDILLLKGVEEMVELYYNSGQFANTLDFLIRMFPDAFSLYHRLSVYYREKGYLINQPARTLRYEILLDFVQNTCPSTLAICRELCTYDYYLRENPKSRPDFCRELSLEEKEYSRAFYIREEETHSYLPAYEAYQWKQLQKMTHLECFRYPVWDDTARGNGFADCSDTARGNVEAAADISRTGGYYVLFDYQKRNPIDCSATITVIMGRSDL